MSELIQMRQRMKAVETIKKITQAMRLISMSTHVRLRGKKAHLEEYKKELTQLYARISQSNGYTAAIQESKPSDKTLIILVGAQKGLCGNFNTNLFYFFEKEVAKFNRDALELIIVGKKIADYAKNNAFPIIQQFDLFTMQTLSTIAQELLNYILSHHYQSVIVYSNYSKSFFAQKAQETLLVPFTPPLQETPEPTEEYIWEQDQHSLLDSIYKQMLYTQIQELLLQSLIAEQAARFIAMDNSTRNAGNLLDTMRLNYNKVRQTKITRELTDLVASM